MLARLVSQSSLLPLWWGCLVILHETCDPAQALNHRPIEPSSVLSTVACTVCAVMHKRLFPRLLYSCCYMCGCVCKSDETRSIKQDPQSQKH